MYGRMNKTKQNRPQSVLVDSSNRLLEATISKLFYFQVLEMGDNAGRAVRGTHIFLLVVCYLQLTFHLIRSYNKNRWYTSGWRS